MTESPAIIVNTSNAIEMKPESPPVNITAIINDPIMSSGKKIAAIHEYNRQRKLNNQLPYEIDAESVIGSKQQQQQQPQPPPNYRHRSTKILGMYSNVKEMILGVCAALIMFLFILTIFCAFQGISKKYKCKNDGNSDTPNKADYLRQLSVNIEER